MKPPGGGLRPLCARLDVAHRTLTGSASFAGVLEELNTARAVIKDIETRRQVHIIKDALSKLGKEFNRFDQRMKKLADHIRMAHQDAEDVQITSQKISRRFEEIEHVRLEGEPEAAAVLSAAEPV